MISLTSRHLVKIDLHEKWFNDTLNFSRFMVQDLVSFFLLSSLVERLTVSLRQCGYSFLPAKEIPDSLSGFIHNFIGGKDMNSG